MRVHRPESVGPAKHARAATTLAKASLAPRMPATIENRRLAGDFTGAACSLSKTRSTSIGQHDLAMGTECLQ